MMTMPMPWTVLLSERFPDVNDEYGPNTQSVAAAFAVLSQTPWFTHVGEPLDNERVTLVHTWDDAVAIFRPEFRSRYNVNGVFKDAYAPLDEALARSPQMKTWWQQARADVNEYTVLDGHVSHLSRGEQDLIYEYLYEFVSMLLVEIIVAPLPRFNAYFREQLAWFHAGRFPCGWDGDWPSGRMRIH